MKQSRRWSAAAVVGGLLILEALGSTSTNAQNTGTDLDSLLDNSWRQLTLSPSSRYLTPQFEVTATPVADPNPRTRAYSGLVGGGNQVFYFGGGHNSYPGNDVEVFDPGARRWEQSYKPEVCPRTDTTAACYSIYSGWGTSTTTPLGRPYVEHTYQISAYDPVRNGLFAILTSGTWAYGFATRKWTALEGPAEGGGFTPLGGTGLRHLFSWDPGLGAFQAVVTTGGSGGVYRFDDSQRIWIKRGMPPEIGWSTLYSTYAPDRGVHFVYGVSWVNRWWRYDARTNVWTALPAPPLVPDSFDYDSRNGVVVAASHPTENELTVMVFDPARATWTVLPDAATAPAMPGGGLTATPMVWRYVPSYNVFVALVGHRGYSAGGPSTTWVYRYRRTDSPSAPPGSDVVPPVVSVVDPAAGATLSGMVSLRAAATDNVGVTSVRFLVDGLEIGTAVAAPYTLTWDTSRAANGTHTITALAQDAAGNTAASPATTITVANVVPTPSPEPAPTPPPTGLLTFAQRCAQPGVVRCFGFDSAEQAAPYVTAADNGASKTTKPTFDPTVRASGPGSLKFTVPPLSGPDSSGSFAMNFTPNSLNGDRTTTYPVQFGEGEEFFVQWRQRFSAGFLATQWKGGGGWKQFIVGEGDRQGQAIGSCTDNDLVVTNYLYRGFPRMYHSCGAKDGKYDPLYEYVNVGKSVPEIRLQNMVPGCIYTKETVPPCIGYKADQWMTFQVHVKIGTWYKNDGNYKYDSLIEFWVAEEGQPSVPVIRLPYDLYTSNGAKYGKLWLTPYNTGKDRTVSYPAAYTWYDDVIVSTKRIADPAVESPGSVVSPLGAPTNLTAVAVGSLIHLAWSAPTGAPTGTRYQVTRDGVAIALTSGLTWDDATVTANRTYVYTVSSVDANGNVSAPSAAVSAQVVSAPTPTPTVSTTLSTTTLSTTTQPTTTQPTTTQSSTTVPQPLAPGWQATLVGDLYGNLLGRPATSQELASGTTSLEGQTATDGIRAFAARLLASDEYLARPLTSRDRALGLYAALLGRQPSATELEILTDALADAVTDKVAAFATALALLHIPTVNSDPAAAARFVTALYLEGLNRLPLASEVTPRADRMTTTGDVTGVVKGILGSDEATRIPRSIAEYVRIVYGAVLGVAPMASEARTWTLYLTTGLLVVEDQFTSSLEFEARFAAAP